MTIIRPVDLNKKRKIAISIRLIDYLFLKEFAALERKTIEQYLEDEISSKMAKYMESFRQYEEENDDKKT